MKSDPATGRDIDREARDWFVLIQTGDASGPGETASGRMQVLKDFQAWKNADPAHAAAYDRLQRLAQQSNVWAQHERIRQSRLKRVSIFKRHPIFTGAIAACLVGAAAITFYRDRMPDMTSASPSQQLLADALYVTRVGEKREIALADGSTILLDADSQVRVSYSAGARSLHLDHGRARFTVAHEASRVFSVDVGDARIIAHGTIFDVTVGSHGVRASLVRGSIEVTGQPRPGGQAASGSRYLKPGEQISFTTASALPTPQAVDAGELNWMSGRLSFRDARLGDAVEEINRYNTRKIVTADPKLAELQVSGGYDAQAPEAFAKAVAKTLGLKCDIRSDGAIILQAGSETSSG